MSEFDFDFDFDDESSVKKKKEKQFICDMCGKPAFKASSYISRKNNNIYRKAFSELNLFDVMPQTFNENDVIHVISGGDVDSLTFIKYLLRFQNLEYLLFSTWCMATDDILLIDEWLKTGKIKRLDAYVGEIFTASYSKEYDLLKSVLKNTEGRICIFRNHSKVFAGTGDKFSFIVESSANINTNPRAENTVITISKEGFKFYKDHFDNINSFSNDFKDWRKYEN